MFTNSEGVNKAPRNLVTTCSRIQSEVMSGEGRPCKRAPFSLGKLFFDRLVFRARLGWIKKVGPSECRMID